MDRILGLQGAESMRNTILLQEQVFKHQVRELHRIYNLQKKLMDEIEKEFQSGVEKGHFQTYITGEDPKDPSSSCSGETNLRMPIKFDLESRSETAPSSRWDLRGINEETDDVEVELTLSIGQCYTRRKQRLKRPLHDSDQVGEQSSSSMGTSKGEECGDPGSNISSSSAYRDSKQPHWLLQDLSLNRT